MKKLSIVQLLITIGVLYFTIACNTIFYAPNAHNVPMLEEEGDIRLNAGLNIGDQIEGADFQAAYALNSKIGLMANGFYTGASGSDKRNGFLVEAAAGRYGKIGKYGRWDAFAGIGEGKVSNYVFVDQSLSKLCFTRAFVQPSIGFRSKAFDAAFSVRGVAALYGQFQYPDTTQNQYYFQPVQAVAGKLFWGVEPTLTVRGGWKYVKLQFQLGVSRMNLPVSYSGGQASLGLQVALNKGMFKKTAK